MRKLNLLGFGGHSKLILDIAKLKNYDHFLVYDHKYLKIDDKTIKYVSSIKRLKHLTKESIISIGVNNIRKKIADNVQCSFWATLIHPKAILAQNTTIGEGTVIMAGAIIQPGVQIGKHCIINSGAVIEHDCIIEDFVHVAPNSSLAGGVKVGEGSLIGIGSSIIPNIDIGSWTTIGAGSVVINDIPANLTAYGNPCRVKENHEKK